MKPTPMRLMPPAAWLNRNLDRLYFLRLNICYRSPVESACTEKRGILFLYSFSSRYLAFFWQRSICMFSFIYATRIYFDIQGVR